MRISYIVAASLVICLVSFSCDRQKENGMTLWYDHPARNWGEAFPSGNGRLATMCFGDPGSEHFLINEESLWAGCQINPVAPDFSENLKMIQKMVLAGDYAKAHDYGIKNLTANPTSFRSYEPFADLIIEFGEQKAIAGYKRELDLSTGVCRVSYTSGKTQIVRESFISAVDDVFCIRIKSPNKKKLNFSVGLERFKDATVTAFPEGKLKLDGQIQDIEAPGAYDDNPGGSGPGGKHMRFSARLFGKTSDGKIRTHGDRLVFHDAGEVVLIFTAVTDYSLSLMNFDGSADPGEKADRILKQAQDKSWNRLLTKHIKEHSELFNRVSIDLGISPNDSLPTDKRIEVFQNGAEDPGLVAQLFQFGRYLLMNSSRVPAVLPANLQGKWSQKEWAPWEADYHLNVNLQMNYWPSDVTNLSETNQPLINWLELLAQKSKPFAKDMYDARGWFSCLATNPFGRVTPSASTKESQFLNGVLDPLAGAWMVMNLWDHYEYSQDQTFLKERLYPLLKGVSEFILDVLVTDSTGKLQFVPSTSPENSYVDSLTGRNLRVTSTSTYHLSIIKAVFEATLEASEILSIREPVCEGIVKAEKLLPDFHVDENGHLMEWQKKMKEAESGHRHLSPLLGVHPFSIITPAMPRLFEAARKSLDWRKENGQGSGGDWSCAHASIMYSWFHDGEKAYDGLKTILDSLNGSLLNVDRIFQIDANFGATACVAEMLVQSHLKDQDGHFMIELLPAVPKAWTHGNVRGLCARGGFVLDFDWADGYPVTAFIYSKKGGECNVRFRDKEIKVSLKAGEKRKLTEL